MGFAAKVVEHTKEGVLAFPYFDDFCTEIERLFTGIEVLNRLFPSALIQGVLHVMAYTGRLNPNRVHF